MGLGRRRPGSIRAFDRYGMLQAVAGRVNADAPDALAQQLSCDGGVEHWSWPAEAHFCAGPGAGCEDPVGTHVQVPLA